MKANYIGALLRRERLARNWSQSGLCKGICAVSYLSKIEQGKVEADASLLRALLERLDIPRVTEQSEEDKAALIASLYELVFMERRREPEDDHRLEQLYAWDGRTLYILDVLLLRVWFSYLRSDEDIDTDKAVLRELEPCMEKRQYTVWLAIQENNEALLHHDPSAFAYFHVGLDCYERGNTALAIEHLQRGYSLAAEDGLVYLMMECQVYLGNCYSNQLLYNQMRRHYEKAERVAKALGDQETLNSIQYNIASTALEIGDAETGYRYFSTLEHPGKMDLHKLAICCEKLGKVQEALDALEHAKGLECEYPPEPLAEKICAIVEYRLHHPDYLKQPEYGALLLGCFEQMRKTLPSGYVSFHLPWVTEWFEANRQYKAAYELLKIFPKGSD